MNNNEFDYYNLIKFTTTSENGVSLPIIIDYKLTHAITIFGAK